MEYTQKDKQAKEIAMEALRMEQKVHQMWEEVAYLQNKQGSLLQWLWENKLHKVIKTVASDIKKRQALLVRVAIELEIETVKDW